MFEHKHADLVHSPQLMAMDPDSSREDLVLARQKIAKLDEPNCDYCDSFLGKIGGE